MSRADGGERPRTGGGGFRVMARRFAVDGRGTTSIEYALIAVMIFVVVAGSLRLVSSKVDTVYTQISNAIAPAN